MLVRALLVTSLLLLAACGNSAGSGDSQPAAAPNDVGAKATADVDAAMAEALPTRAAPPVAATPQP